MLYAFLATDDCLEKEVHLPNFRPLLITSQYGFLAGQTGLNRNVIKTLCNRGALRQEAKYIKKKYIAASSDGGSSAKWKNIIKCTL